VNVLLSSREFVIVCRQDHDLSPVTVVWSVAGTDISPAVFKQLVMLHQSSERAANYAIKQLEQDQ
jgi:hypothetical protein